uniref:PCI domain-containing protein n=1 Tax=Octactis speculum TaxID=3111310 RepID=A0A7S2H012_9STRA|mmetsp:Transcript_59927/g.82001  ORF Transcript_59927/g.82001 Transcript_59927/m.82001 type:complete len:487 (+) Transcript_59927:37-1497(+)
MKTEDMEVEETNGTSFQSTDASAEPSLVSLGPLPIPPDKAVDAPGFDLQSYIGRYTQQTKIARLQLIAQTCPALQVEAYHLLMQELRQGLNSDLYNSLAVQLGPQFAKWGPQWVEEVERRATATLESLNTDINQAKANLEKDTIRAGYNALGEFFYNRGDLNQAMKYFVRTRDYCSTNRHMTDMCLKVIHVSMDVQNYVQMSNHVNKAEHLSDTQADRDLTSKLAAVTALGLLRNKQYKQAARKFLSVGPELGDGFNEVIVAEDVATYAGVCALATFERDDLRSLVLQSDFKNFLDLMPRLRDLIHAMYESRYGAALQILESMRGELLLDIHLKDHVEPLFTMIHDRGLTQYFSPYLSVNLNAMAEAFSRPAEEIEAQVARLIMDGQIKAGIDSQTKTLHVRHNDKRAATYSRVEKMGNKCLCEMRSLLLRMSCLEEDLLVRARPSMVGAMSGGLQDPNHPECIYMPNSQDSSMDAGDTGDMDVAI